MTKLLYNKANNISEKKNKVTQLSLYEYKKYNYATFQTHYKKKEYA